jgi:hypothetical protein
MSPPSSNEDEERKVQWDEGKEHGEGVLKKKLKKRTRRILKMKILLKR